VVERQGQEVGRAVGFTLPAFLKIEELDVAAVYAFENEVEVPAGVRVGTRGTGR
jgi:hypothetical protein